MNEDLPLLGYNSSGLNSPGGRFSPDNTIRISRFKEFFSHRNRNFWMIILVIILILFARFVIWAPKKDTNED